MGFEKNYDKPTPKNIWEFIYKNAAIRLVILAVCILSIGYCVNQTTHAEKPKDVFRYEIKTSNWLGSTYYKCAWYERTEQGTYILYSEDSTLRKEIEVGAGWKIEITNIENK